MNSNKKYINYCFVMLVMLVFFTGFYSLIRVPKDTSIVENRKLTTFPLFNYKLFLNGEYQNALENALSDQFIGSESIRTNYNKVFKFPFASSVKKSICKNNYFSLSLYKAIYNCGDYLVEKPKKMTKDMHDIMSENIKYYSKLNNTIDTYYYFITTSDVFDFRTNSYSMDIPKYIKKEMKGNYTFDYLKINNYNDYKKYFYKTDHHWSYKGSFLGYKDIISMITGDEAKKPVEEVSFDDIYFNGSSSKDIKMFNYKEKFKAYKFNLEPHITYVDGEEGIYGGQDKYFNKDYKRINYINHYAEFYGFNPKELIFDFKHEDKDNLLILSNSYSNAVDELIASHFNKTYVLHREYKDGNFDIYQYIKNRNINKVLFIVDYSYLISENSHVGMGV